MTPEEFREYLKEQSQKFGSQKAFARYCGVNEAFLSDVMRGRRDPSAKFLWALGFRRVVTYERIREE